MDFPGYQLPDELQLLQQTVRRIIQEEIVPLERSMDPEATELDDANWLRLATMHQNAGLWALGAPAAYGGGGLGTFAYCIVLEEMAQHRNGLYNPGYATFGRYPPNVCYAGSPEQLQRSDTLFRPSARPKKPSLPSPSPAVELILPGRFKRVECATATTG
jgi:alkylation response protein AidB-like acyl-CoA dehydrogenase